MASSLVGSPGTATSATVDLTQRGSLCPGLCWPLAQESYSSPVSGLQAQPESCSPVAAQGEDNQTGDSHLQSCRSEAIKPNTEKKIRKEYSGNYVILGTLAFTNG